MSNTQSNKRLRNPDLDDQISRLGIQDFRDVFKEILFLPIQTAITLSCFPHSPTHPSIHFPSLIPLLLVQERNKHKRSSSNQPFSRFSLLDRSFQMRLFVPHKSTLLSSCEEDGVFLRCSLFSRDTLFRDGVMNVLKMGSIKATSTAAIASDGGGIPYIEEIPENKPRQGQCPGTWDIPDDLGPHGQFARSAPSRWALTTQVFLLVGKEFEPRIKNRLDTWKQQNRRGVVAMVVRAGGDGGDGDDGEIRLVKRLSANDIDVWQRRNSNRI
ncbi:hypothetical protein V1477_000043 [Vespula maculifrons]|uniref:Uncharacterized protein n=1 Tax=Vespula maculifrons TaxID=7453 RepID=A0ABD2D2Y4_VESMC